MALNDKKITAYANPVANLPDHPSSEGWSAAALKAAFDANATGEIKAAINGIIDNLLSKTSNDSGADNIGSTAISGVTGDTVRGQLLSLKALIDATALGQIPDGTITDAKLSNAAGQIKATVNTLDTNKANKIPPNWAAAVFENSWTGAIYYRKNNIGQLEFQGYISGGTLNSGTIITTLPEGSRPTRNTAVIGFISGVKMTHGLVLNTDGTLKIYAPATTDLSGGNSAIINMVIN